MFLLVVTIIFIAFFLFIFARICRSCCTCFYKLSERIFKEVVLTLILFNQLNFAYSAGIHFKYAPASDPLYVLGTLAAIATMVLQLLMVLLLECSEEKGFGEFKGKLKRGCF